MNKLSFIARRQRTSQSTSTSRFISNNPRLRPIYDERSHAWKINGLKLFIYPSPVEVVACGEISAQKKGQVVVVAGGIPYQAVVENSSETILVGQPALATARYGNTLIVHRSPSQLQKIA
ncbi:hypothetical protein [cf. Phormidesmis sp. LEGE 11477]|uniref:hypothetical protein n=1 Tax=cf. Phormidesmis sp. LEGE 11477 TaxID=1828680 RepID=UPI001882ED65|nr:hypothetical protein [cf. Phormidesmis sp. LEGE 11477]MBE9064701.1 hypothetical protein [cf. Phormidesmis sp. LEGE 11477]